MKLKNQLITIILITVALSLTSCLDIIDCINGNNHLTTENRNLPSFRGVISRGSFEVRIIQGTTNKVEVEAESNLQNHINTRVSGNNLIIDTQNNRCLNVNYPIIITVTTVDLNKVELDGSGTVRCDEVQSTEMDVNLSGSGSVYINLNVEDLYAGISGSGSINLEGTAINSKLTISGSGDIHAKDLIQDHCMANISGSGKMYIYVSETLDARISGSGNVYYDGNPSITTHISGSGKVRHI